MCKVLLASVYCLQAENGLANSMQPPMEDGADDGGDEDDHDTVHGMDIEQGNQVQLPCLVMGSRPALMHACV